MLLTTGKFLVKICLSSGDLGVEQSLIPSRTMTKHIIKVTLGWFKGKYLGTTESKPKT